MIESAIGNAIGEVYDRLSQNDLLGASMLAEEVLADAFRQWQRDKGRREACELVAATCAYASAMSAMQREPEAYASCMTALAYTARSEVDAAGRLALCLIAWRILEKTLSSTQPTDNSSAIAHVNELTRNLGSLMYKYYYATGQNNPDDPSLNDAYESLRIITGMVSIEPHLQDVTRAISEVLRHSEAIGLIQ